MQIKSDRKKNTNGEWNLIKNSILKIISNQENNNLNNENKIWQMKEKIKEWWNWNKF